MLTETSRAVVLAGEHAETTQPAPATFDRHASPIRLLADAPDDWRALRRVQRGQQPALTGVSWQRARELVAQATIADGTRSDRGLGAADRLVLDVHPRTGVLYMTAAATQGGRVAPLFDAVPVRAQAFRQIAASIKAPAPYLARLPASLALACVQHGLEARRAEDETATALLRLAGGEARAIVSGRYAVLDDLRFLDVTERALVAAGVDLDSIRVNAVLTGRRTLVRITMPHRVVRVDGGADEVEVGLDLLNAELGNGAASVLPLVYRLVCSNGLRAWAQQGSRRVVRHVGDPARAVEVLRDAIPAALDDASGAVDAIKAATRRVVERAAEEFAGLRIFGLTAAETRTAASTFAAERGVALPADTKAPAWREAWTQIEQIGPVTSWDVTNAVTAMARDVQPERRLELETAAGEYLRDAVS